MNYPFAARKRALKFLLAGLVLASRCEPHNGPTETVVGQLAERLTGADKKGVVVMDLAPTFGPYDSFGAWLSDQLSLSLAHETPNVEVIDRLRLREALKVQNLPSPSQQDVKSVVALGRSIGATTVVVGSYGAAENGIGVSLVAFRVAEYGKSQPRDFMICMVFGKIPLTREIDVRLGIPLDSLRPKDGVYRSGYGGVSIPTCVKCPIPGMKVPDVDLQGMLRAHPLGGSVLLRFVVTPEGHTQNIAVIQPVGYGFDDRYVKAAKDWELKPAVDADNKPVPVLYDFQISFNFK
jgi:TonB family protein